MIAVAQHIADAAVAAGAPRDRITVIPNGVDVPAEPAPPALARPIRIGQLARLDAQKGIDVFLEAIEHVTEPAQFALGSPLPENDFGRALHERATALGVEVVAPASRAFLETLDIVAAPSLQEGHSVTLMEAMALAKPVVAAAIPGVTEMLQGEDAGLLVPPRDPEALATALDLLAGDAALRSRLGARARELVTARYALPVVHARIIDLLERAAAAEAGLSASA
jgi:glycosyltransferase involved in cell wall biosynthesis